MGRKNTLAIGSNALHDHSIRVTVPAKVAYDLESIQKVQASILDRLGCPACCSGYDIRFDITRSYLVDKKLNIREIAERGTFSDG